MRKQELEIRKFVNTNGSLSIVHTIPRDAYFVSYVGITYEIEVDGNNVFSQSYKHPPSAYYFVFVEGGQFPEYRHDDIHSALTEARRLHELTGRSTYVCYFGVEPTIESIDDLGKEIEILLKKLT